jgi:hypothetical protein
MGPTLLESTFFKFLSSGFSPNKTHTKKKTRKKKEFTVYAKYSIFQYVSSRLNDFKVKIFFLQNEIVYYTMKDNECMFSFCVSLFSEASNYTRDENTTISYARPDACNCKRNLGTAKHTKH